MSPNADQTRGRVAFVASTESMPSSATERVMKG